MGKRQRVTHSVDDKSETGYSPEPSDFIGYNSLPRQDRLFFSHCGIDRFIAVSARMLAKRIGLVEIYKLDQPYLSDEGLNVLNGLVGELLEMIGRHSNQRFGSAASHQHRYFQRPSERNSFPTQLLISRWYESRDELIRKNKANERTIARNGDGLPGKLCSKKAFKGISAAKKLRFGKSKLTETETRAVGVLYMVNLVWKAMQESCQTLVSGGQGQPEIAKTLYSGVMLFSLLDESDQMGGHSEAGRLGDKKIQYREAARIVRQIVKGNLDLSTKTLSKRAKVRLDGECIEGKTPSSRWIEDQIRKLKNSFRRN